MSVAPEDFRQALKRFASGVTVVTSVTADGDMCGVTVSAFSSVSLSPPLILICLDDITANLETYTEGAGFCVNILAAGQEDVSNAFAFPGPTSPFEAVSYAPGLHGAPVLADALATLQCSLESAHRAGDHTIVIGLVEEASWRDGAEPLVYAGGAYRSLAAQKTDEDAGA